MDNIGEYMLMLEQIKAESVLLQQKELTDRHKTKILTTYESLKDDINNVLEKHFEQCLLCDIDMDNELAEVQQRLPLSNELIFSLVTGKIITQNVASITSAWVSPWQNPPPSRNSKNLSFSVP